MIAVPTRVRQLSTQVSETRSTPWARDLALLGARLGLAWLFIYHGGTTLFGIFGGAGLHSASIFFGSVAHLHPQTFFAAMAGIIEFFGGIAIALGIFGRLAGAALVGDMVIAMATVTFGNGIVSNAPGAGYELNIALATLALVIAVLGTGRLSLDVALHNYFMKSTPAANSGTSLHGSAAAELGGRGVANAGASAGGRPGQSSVGSSPASASSSDRIW